MYQKRRNLKARVGKIQANTLSSEGHQPWTLAARDWGFKMQGQRTWPAARSRQATRTNTLN